LGPGHRACRDISATLGKKPGTSVL
jgi:hypothetical protein